MDATMNGTMMYQPLTVGSLIDHAMHYHASTEVVSVETSGEVETLNWGRVADNARRLGAVLDKLGVAPGSRCATIAWNNRRHLEIYYGVASSGRITHTVNPRLHPDQLTFIMEDADDQVLFIDRTFLSAVASLKPKLKSIRHFVLMGGRDAQAEAMLDGLQFYDELLEGVEPLAQWPDLDENSAAALCYTSGTTGNPKGVQYTHRSTVLHSLLGNQPDGVAVAARDTVLPVVPMFHVNAWGVPYIAAAVGAKLVLPGPNLDGDSLVSLINDQSVTLALGVPTIWMGLLDALARSGKKPESLVRTVVGGSALPPSMIEVFRDKYDVELIHAWGMTETSPLGTVNQLLQKHDSLDDAAKNRIRQGQGRPPYGVTLRLVDEAGKTLPHDGQTQGDLQIRGHWIVESYFGKSQSALTEDGWFDTGDVATVDEDGYMIIRDRSKDIIKSGGEWISTVELENIAIAHPDISNAAVIAARHRKWDERPVLVAIREEASTVTEQALQDFYQGKIPGWQVPDTVIFVDSLPLGATGKVMKNQLRERYGDILLQEGE